MPFEAYLSSLEKCFSAIPFEEMPETVEEYLQPIIKLKKNLWLHQRKVTFFGAFKAGKSTLINAIVGETVLPSRANRATGIVTRICYSPQKTARLIHQLSNDDFQAEEVNYQKLAQYILLDVSEGISQVSFELDAVTLGIPLKLLQHHCVLVDTPGLMDHFTLTKRTYQELEKSDLAVMVLSADKILSEGEKEAIEEINQLLNGNIVFVINRLDLVEQKERGEIIQWTTTALQGIGNSLVGKPRVFATLAKDALVAKQNGEQTGWAFKSVLNFERWLETLLKNSSRDELAILSRLGVLESYLVKASDYFKVRFLETQSITQSLMQAEQKAFTEQEKTLKNSLRADLLLLANFRGGIDLLGENFVNDCITRIKKLMDSDSNWSDKLQNCLNSALDSYVQNINYQISSLDFQTDIQIPQFTLEESSTETQVNAIQDSSASIGFWVGAVVGGIMTGGIGAAIGGGTGAWISKSIFGVDTKDKTLELVKQSARNLLPKLRTDLEKYIDDLHELLIEANQLKQTIFQPSFEVKTAARTKQYYTQLIDWCNDFQNTINQIKTEIIIK